MACVRFKHVTVQYPIYNNRALSMRNQFLRIGTGGRIEAEAGQVQFVTALHDVSFELKDGDSVGLIGHNGAGKTTLLRTMAGIYLPTSGQVEVEGRLATVFDLGAGMDAELSGYENVTRMALLMGLQRSEIAAILPSIEEFTDLGHFLQLPVRTYSSGMTMRLMFAVATAIRPEILLIDEMFGTGDADFQIKAQARMKDLIDGAKIFVFASHSIDLLKQYCKRVFRLEHSCFTEIPIH